MIKSAHVNICRVQGQPSVPFKLDKALPGLNPWYQPYLSLLNQVGSHLNRFEPELRGNPSLSHVGSANSGYHLARLCPLVENAGIKIVQVPTLTENTISQRRSPPPAEREFSTCPTVSSLDSPLSLGKNNHAMSTGAKDNSISAGASAQATSLSNQMQQSGTILPVTNLQPPKKGRRKLNRAIFDVDTAAALRIKVQAEPPTAGTNSPSLPEGIVQQEAAGAAIPTDSPLKGSSEGVPEERPLIVGNVPEEQLRTKSKEVSRRTSGARVTANQEWDLLGQTVARGRSCRFEPHSWGRIPTTRGARCNVYGLW